MLDNVIIILLIIGAFLAGKFISDSYNDKIVAHLEYALKISAADKGYGYIAPPVKKQVPIGQSFMDRLKENGQAVQALRSPRS